MTLGGRTSVNVNTSQSESDVYLTCVIRSRVIPLAKSENGTPRLNIQSKVVGLSGPLNIRMKNYLSVGR